MYEASRTNGLFSAPLFEDRNWKGELRGCLALSGGVEKVFLLGLVTGQWVPASHAHEQAVLAKFAAFRGMKPGDQVVAWTGTNMVAGYFVERDGDKFIVAVDRARDNDKVPWVLPMDVASRFDVWLWKKDFHVVADVNGEWRECIWCSYVDGEHLVRDSQGRHYWVRDVTTECDAIDRELLRR